MVWGMSLPSRFGEFWPEGSFELDPKTRERGWGARLREYFLAQTPEEQTRLIEGVPDPDPLGRAYAYHVSRKFIAEIGVSAGPQGSHFSPIEAQEAPRSFTTAKTFQSLGSLINLSDRIVAVDAVLKTIIERLEPGVHQFFPIEIVMPKGVTFPKAYYVLVIGQYHDSFSPENSNKDSWSDYGPNYPDFYFYKYDESKSGVAGLALSQAVFDRSHLWRERRFNAILICFSDQLQAEITNAGLRLPKHYQMVEV